MNFASIGRDGPRPNSYFGPMFFKCFFETSIVFVPLLFFSLHLERLFPLRTKCVTDNSAWNRTDAGSLLFSSSVHNGASNEKQVIPCKWMESWPNFCLFSVVRDCEYIQNILQSPRYGKTLRSFWHRNWQSFLGEKKVKISHFPGNMEDFFHLDSVRERSSD